MTLSFARRACTLILLALVAVTLASMAWPALATADVAAGTSSPVDAPLLDLARLIYDGVTSGQLGYLGAAAGALVLLTRVLRQYGAQLVPWFGGDAGGTVLVLAGSLGGAVLTALLGGASPSWSLAWYALGVAFAAGGGYAMVRRLVIHPLQSRVAAWPAPLRVLYRLASWAFDRPGPTIITTSYAETDKARGTISTLLVLLLALALSSCTSSQRSAARHAGAAGVDVGLRCQASSLAGVALEAYELARGYLWSRISDEGEVDTEAIRAAARQVRSDAGRCAFAAAMASITDLLAQRRGALAVGASPAQAMRQAFAEVQQFDWHVTVTVEGEVLP